MCKNQKIFKYSKQMWKIINNTKHMITSLIYYVFISIRFPWVNTCLMRIRGGFPYFYISTDSKLYIGNNFQLNNNTSSNGVGINKRSSFYVTKGGNLSIGNYCGFSGVSIYCCKSISIGNNVLIGANTFIWDTDFHSIKPLDRYNESLGLTFNHLNIKKEEIIIEDNVFIGANCIILKGTKIGNNSIVAAGSVVTKSIPCNQIWAGNPARFIKEIENSENITQN